jgi:fatty-acyl-CoA synthase
VTRSTTSGVDDTVAQGAGAGTTDLDEINPTTIGAATAAAPARNYVAEMLDLFEQFGEHEAVVRGERRITYTGLRAMVLEMAASLRDQGLRSGTGVALLVNNLPESIATQFALHLIGCRTVWIAGYAPAREQVEFVELADVDTLIIDPARQGAVIDRITERERPLLVLYAGPGGPGPDITAPRAEGSPDFEPDPQAAAPQSLFYTGGTTGVPKLVHHEHRFFQALMAAAAYFRSIGEPGMRHLSTTGFVHVSGQMPVVLALCEDGTVFLQESVDMDDFLGTIARERVTSVFISPARLYELLDLPDGEKRIDFSSIRYLNCGGGPIRPARLGQAIERFGPIVRPVYGLSEIPLLADWPFMTADPAHPERLGSCGRPFADAKIAIRDEDGRDLEAGQIGEVCAAGSLLMSGYWGQPDLTGTALRDGWLRTGDMGYLDEDGYLYLVDRAGDMIVTGIGAMNVYTRPIEEALAGHPAVAAAAVIGLPDPAVNDIVCAFVVADPEAVTADELRDLVTAQLSKVHSPRIVEFVDRLPRTAMDKVDKKALRAAYIARDGESG